MNQHTDIEDRFAVLVVSCDKYSDLWGPFFELFSRFWPDCPFDVYLISNTLRCDIPGVKNLLVGEDVSWSDNLRTAIGELKHEYVLLFLDDLFLFALVDRERVSHILQWMVNAKPNYVRLNPSQKPDKPFNEWVGVVSKGTIYRTSTILSVWKRDVLRELLEAGESAWDFEIHGSVRSDKYDQFYSSVQDSVPVINVVVKGKWQRQALRALRALGVNPDLQSREVMTVKETITLFLRRRQYEAGKYDHQVVAALKTLRDVGICDQEVGFELATPAEDVVVVERWWEEFRLKDRFTIAVHPGSNHRVKQWPIEKFEILGTKLLESRGDISLVVVGGEGDKGLGDRLVESWGRNALNLSGKATLVQAVDVLRRCRLFIGNDSGPMHLAAAVGTPTIGVFSSIVFPVFWKPWGPDSHMIRHSVPCEFCFTDDGRCPTGTYECINGITVDEVFEACLPYLKTNYIVEQV